MSFSVPTTTITPQPITKLPNSSDQRTCAAPRGAERVARPGGDARRRAAAAPLNDAP